MDIKRVEEKRLELEFERMVDDYMLARAAMNRPVTREQARKAIHAILGDE
jgi:hypothetical protein